MSVYKKEYDINKIKPISQNNIWYKLCCFKEYNTEHKFIFFIIKHLFMISVIFLGLFVCFNIIDYLGDDFDILIYKFSCFVLFVLFYLNTNSFFNKFLKKYKVINDNDFVKLYEKLSNKPDIFSNKTKYLFKKQGVIIYEQFNQIYCICNCYEKMQEKFILNRIRILKEFFVNESSLFKTEFYEILDIQKFLSIDQIIYFEKEKESFINVKKAKKIKECINNN